ncbi:MAG TPA: ABC transporter ATP-binding protein [Xanthobacteraceae bacterium]|nr:ABC transporter ATP-binding protein [Xanthobacteraceae bacterium]
MQRRQISRFELASYLLSPSLFVMVIMMVVEAMLAAATTWLVINAGRKVAVGQFLLTDLVWILTAQSASYVVGVISWIFAERAGYRGFGKFMLRFARENRDKVKLLNEKPARERVEPFLTGETFQCFFNVMYELEFALKLFLGLAFNAVVLGVEIDVSLPVAYVGAFGALLLMQWVLQKPIARAYLENQRMNNRVTAQGYTAWDNVFAGNSYNLRLWLAGFKTRLREGLVAQIRAIVAREGMSAMSGIVSLAIVFAAISVVAVQHVGDTALLVGLATTLPRQIEMTYELHLLATGWNDFIAIWTRFGGVAANMLPEPDADFDKRIKFDRLVLREGDHANVVSSLGDALRIAYAQPTGRINVRGGNATGKSSLLAALKTEMKKRAYYWPTTDRLAFQFAGGVVPVEVEGDHEDEVVVEESMDQKLGFSSGERQLKSLQEIVSSTAAEIYLLDEWDANLDAANRAKADALVDELAGRARVIEISHRDRAA